MNKKAQKEQSPPVGVDQQVRALLTVARDPELASVWTASGRPGLTIADVARVALTFAGLTEEEIVSVMRHPAGRPAGSSTTKSWRVWTTEDDARLKRLWAAGKSTGEIARTLRRTPSSVSLRVSKLRRLDKSVAVRRQDGAASAAVARKARAAKLSAAKNKLSAAKK
jgi:DNA-binding CsgD family transcriptional regulator